MSLNLNFVLGSLPCFILVLVRMVGCISFNPFLGRRNIPFGMRNVLAFFLALILTPLQPKGVAMALSTVELLVGMFKELFIGFCCGFIFTIFYYMIFFICDIIDMQMGLSMAKVMDPATNIQSSITGMFVSIVYVLFFFATDCHLVLIKMFANSFLVIPPGGAVNFAAIPGFMFGLFASTFSLILKLGLPFIAAELIVEMGLGILMKLIPQIHIFVINIQIKILLGLIALIVFAGPISNFLDLYMDTMMKDVEHALAILGKV
ncbi:MAG: flagellar biosynthetic protein FliR [Oscillospiraceae bacterium]